MKGFCPRDGVPTSEEVELPDTGTVTTFAVNNIPDPRAPEVPFVSGYVLLDGAGLTMLTLVAGIPADQVRMGMRVKAAWRPREGGPTRCPTSSGSSRSTSPTSPSKRSRTTCNA